MSAWGTEGEASDEPSSEPPAERAPLAPTDARQPSGDRTGRPAREPEPTPDWLRSSPDPDAPVPPDRDPVAVVAVACGFLGIVIFGLLFAVVTAVLGAWAGQRARDTGRTYELPFLAIGLAFVDGAVWIALHLLIDAPAWIG